MSDLYLQLRWPHSGVSSSNTNAPLFCRTYWLPALRCHCFRCELIKGGEALDGVAAAKMVEIRQAQARTTV